MHKHHSALGLATALKPVSPVTLVRPHAADRAAKHAADGVTVNDVAPAMIGDTGMIPDETRVEGTPGDVRNIPVGRLGTPQECANVVTMFCKTGYLTGQSILLSGGLK